MKSTKMVNVFIIVPDIYLTAQMLDRERLCKQRVEAYQIITSLEEFDTTGKITKGWANHPALKSWIGYTNHLKVYFNIIVREWVKRGYENNMALYPIDETPYNIVPCGFENGSITYDATKFNAYSFPFWISFYPFYMSHQASLCRKNPKYYKFLLRDELKPFLNNGYLWPCNVNTNCYLKWDFSYHENLACGTPAVYRISPIEVLRWLTNISINPKTGRNIKVSGDIYKDFEEAMNEHGFQIYNNCIYYQGNLLCYCNYIEYGISYLSSLPEKDACTLVYEKSQK